MLHNITLEMNDVRLRPMTCDDGVALFPHITAQLWAGMSTPVPQTADDFAEQFQKIIDTPTTLPFAVEHRGKLVGRTCFYDMVMPLRLEIGQTFYIPAAQGTVVNPTAKLLLLTHAFETLHVQRVGLRCDVRNTRSAAAIAKLGAIKEGIQHAWRQDPYGQVVDTAIFAITATQWPQVKTNLTARVNNA